MKSLVKPQSAVLFFAVLSSSGDAYNECLDLLSMRYGRIVEHHPPLPFINTAYYQPEMGSGLKKGFIAFEPPFHQDMIVAAKLFARHLERYFANREMSASNHFRRIVNIDPGYVSLSKVVLSTSKNFSHRIYLNTGVFAEITLIYHPKHWEQLPWTYPDYKFESVQAFLFRSRHHLKRHLNQQSS